MLPVLALLSQSLVAHTVEVDNEVERRLPHFTMKHGSSNPGFGSPWLISSAFWFNVLRHIGPGTISMADLATRSGHTPERVRSAVAGLVRWGYVLHHADPNDSRPKPPTREWVVIPTTNGKRWHDVFPEVIAAVEAAWHARYGAETIAALRDALAAELPPAATPLPQFVPFVGREYRTLPIEPEPHEPEPLCLGSLMARVLLGQAYAIEPQLPLGLAVSATIVRAARDDGALVRDLPQRSGVAKQEVTTMSNHLVRHGHATIEPDPSAKGAKRLRLTGTGAAALDAYERAAAAWDPPPLRRVLASLAPDPSALHSAGGWRSKVKAPDTLPHYPVVTGHGGLPGRQLTSERYQRWRASSAKPWRPSNATVSPSSVLTVPVKVPKTWWVSLP